MARGITRQALFGDDQDREDFLYRLCALARTQALRVYGWVVRPKHVHLLVRTGHKALAGAYLRRHRRSGHLFQNRIKFDGHSEDVGLRSVNPPYGCGEPQWEITRMKNEFTAIIEQDGELYIAYCPEIPGANGQGKTKDEALEN